MMTYWAVTSYNYAVGMGNSREWVVSEHASESEARRAMKKLEDAQSRIGYVQRAFLVRSPEERRRLGLTGDGSKMNRQAVARELVKIARILAAADDAFTVKIEKPLRFKPEGSTMFSLTNARMIKDAGYEFVKGIYAYNRNMAEWRLNAFFRRDGDVADHVFKGFSFGYGGEGPHGMMEFSDMFGIGLRRDKVLGNGAGLPESGTFDLVQAFG